MIFLGVSNVYLYTTIAERQPDAFNTITKKHMRETTCLLCNITDSEDVFPAVSQWDRVTLLCKDFFGTVT